MKERLKVFWADHSPTVIGIYTLIVIILMIISGRVPGAIFPWLLGIMFLGPLAILSVMVLFFCLLEGILRIFNADRRIASRLSGVFIVIVTIIGVLEIIDIM